jgi:trimeric autotransporter adhesin
MTRTLQSLPSFTLCLIALLAAVTIQAQTPAQNPAQSPDQNASQSSNTTVPRLIRFTGTAHDLNGTPLSGVVGITFSLYAEQTGGAALWIETQNAQADSGGHYSVLLGSTKPDGLPADIFASEQARWIGIQIEQQAEQPRSLLVSAPYALKAGDAETLGGLPPSAFILAGARTAGAGGTPSSQSSQPSPAANTGAVSPKGSSDVTTTGGTVKTIPLFTTTTNIQNSILTQTGTTAVSVKGNLTATGVVSGSSYNIGTNPFAFGSYAKENAFLGFAGNSSATGTANTGTGYGALKVLSNGIQNTANGWGALQANTSGSANTAIGLDALIKNVSGDFNTAAGSQALLESTGGSNTAVGEEALENNSSGSGNTGIGVIAGYSQDGSFITGSYNTLLGAVSSLGTGSLTNATAVGAHAEVAESNALVLGSISPAVYVGIGTTTPQYALDVSGVGNFTSNNANDSAVNAYGFTAASGSSESGTNGFYARGGGGDTQNGTFVSDGSGAYLIGGTGTENGDGVYAINGSGYAGNFNGNVNISGTCTGCADISIDDPLDPANKYFRHAPVNSSEMMNIYSGNITTDTQGNATVHLPEWFEVVNTDFRYQLTVLGQFAQAIVANEIHDHQFSIRTSVPGVKVSWQVTGVRQDAWAKAHPLVVEPEKEARVKGFYIHPEFYGAPADKQIEWARHPQMMKQIQHQRQTVKPK